MTAVMESLRHWNSLLMWIGIVAPILGALVGATAGVAHFYVNRYEDGLRAETYREKFEGQERELSSSRAEFEALRASTAPRALAQPAAARLTAALQKISLDRVALITRVMDVECANYAKQIGAAFEAAGWQVIYNASSLNDHTGVVVGFRIGDDPDICAHRDAVVAGLEEAGIAVSGGPIRKNSFSGELPMGALVLWVGARGTIDSPDAPNGGSNKAAAH